MQDVIESSRLTAVQKICLISGEELARAAGFSGVSDGFRAWCKKAGITPVPGLERRYDPKLVRQRLDEMQGMLPDAANQNAASLVEQRRARRGAR
ncbi:hypothetical protein [Defluviimonas sp. WL0075]|uniref:Uncharacterized protein n=1 Tax=Albidovulum sediminicola TaxID=2984331 RepID=A0ABT2Z5Y2_9RHOB|nr:hypothetical protein [Defluviimonas sp. WL0075]MCV2866507.1 hypothetical protein [Defluviimonas sp. WL0075]